MICVSCLSAYQSVVVAQEHPKAMGNATAWQNARPRTIALPQVTPASGQQTATPSISTGTEFVVSPSPQVELGFPQTARQSDPIPSSPWSLGNQANPVSAPLSDLQSATSQPSKAKDIPGYQPRFIEQPSREGSSPKQAPRSDQKSDGYDFEISNPLAQSHSSNSQFYTASTAQIVEQPFNAASHQATVDSTFQTGTQQSSNANGFSAPSGWNQLPIKGVQVNSYLDGTIPAQPVAAPRQVVVDAPELVPSNQVTAPTAVSNVVDSDALARELAAMQAEEEQLRREKIAEQVSKQLLTSNRSSATPPKAIESPRGWKAVEEDLRFRLKNCDDLLRRGATQSAREEVLIGLNSLCRAIDVRKGASQSESSLQSALTAFEEEKDFYRDRSSGAADVSGHQTPVLRSKQTINLSPIVASQHYRAYAKQQLIATSQGHPWAAELYYALGRTLESESESSQEFSYMLREQAIACYQAALAVDRNHADAANQLGYSLLRVDRPQEAEAALTASLAITPTAQAWKNLAEVYRRTGDVNRNQFAVEQAMVLDNQSVRMMNGQPMPPVLEMSAEQFAQISPNTLQGAPNTQYLQQAPNNQVAAPLTATSAEPAKAGKFEAIKRMFR